MKAWSMMIWATYWSWPAGTSCPPTTAWALEAGTALRASAARRVRRRMTGTNETRTQNLLLPAARDGAEGLRRRLVGEGPVRLEDPQPRPVEGVRRAAVRRGPRVPVDPLEAQR